MDQFSSKILPNSVDNINAYCCWCFSCVCLQRESNDSGTESDGELLDVENKRHLDVDMETSE